MKKWDLSFPGRTGLITHVCAPFLPLLPLVSNEAWRGTLCPWRCPHTFSSRSHLRGACGSVAGSAASQWTMPLTSSQHQARQTDARSASALPPSCSPTQEHKPGPQKLRSGPCSQGCHTVRFHIALPFRLARFSVSVSVGLPENPSGGNVSWTVNLLLYTEP